MKEAMLLGSEKFTDSVKVGHEPFNSKFTYVVSGRVVPSDTMEVGKPLSRESCMPSHHHVYRPPILAPLSRADAGPYLAG